jgi:catechol 2,3-dioxygenase-like lactoylglutathione lyase family enzyme
LGKEVSLPQGLTQTTPKTTSVAVKEIDRIGFTVSNLDEVIIFFTEALEFKKIAEFDLSGLEFDTLTGIPNSKVKIAQLKLGDQILELTQYLTPKGRPIPVPSYSNDLSFQHIAIVVRDMDKAYNHLRQFKIRSISSEPQTIPPENKEAAGIRAFKFTDTDGHPLELLYFPPDKGKAIWHQPSDQLFLGIDHTAISISNTSKSLDFYQKVLEMKVLGQGTNSGVTQEKLDNLPNVRVFITAITPPTIVPSMEFLDYKTPPRKQSKPINVKVNDLLSWQTTIVVDDAELAYKILQKNITTQLISSKVVTFSDSKLGFKKAFLLKDTDGHILRFIEK